MTAFGLSFCRAQKLVIGDFNLFLPVIFEKIKYPLHHKRCG